MNLNMSLANNKTQELFSSFMPLRKTIEHATSTDVFEVMIYDQMYFQGFDPSKTFVKWAAIEVSNNETPPTGMTSLELEDGLYAVFNYKGIAKDFGELMRRIFMEWFPSSTYELDHRAHFNVLGDTYKRNDPSSEEEVWIPIRVKD